LRVERCTSPAQAGWLELRRELWPECPEADHAKDRDAACAQPARLAAFVAYADDGTPAGFIEVSTRGDYVNGASSSPVGFVEGLYVAPAARGKGIARKLLQAGEDWARERGCSEMASDVLLENKSGQAAHEALGFAESDRVVYYLKAL
jgi:aminoglycoside 6'-N-acetyltransferase I